jgi:cytochrome c-type biogenesis protein CcmF
VIPEKDKLLEAGFRQAEAWSVAMGSCGKGLILAGLAFFLFSVFTWARKREKLGSLSMILGSACLFAAFLVLGSLFVKDQFQYEYVRARAMANSEIQYKIAGIWAGQQGSFLLWACCSAFFALFAARRTGPDRRWFSIVSSLFLGALCAILAYETPFQINQQVFAHGAYWIPPDGVGLTPSLQNYWVVIHPPTIFLGFGSLLVPFAWAVSAMVRRDPITWVAGVRPWTILSTAITGLGLCMGGFWAYETLGWGGFWAWDPVENVSFVPWLMMAVLIHGLIVQTVRGKWTGTNLLVAGLPFLAFVYGTFLTRSGFLGETSVHSFAEMERTALWILVGILGIALFGFLGLWIAVGRRLGSESAPLEEVGLPREKAYGIGMAMMSLTAIATAIGMSIPVISTLRGRQQVASEHDYHVILSWFFVPIMLLMAVAPFLSWRGLPIRKLIDRLFGVICVSIGSTGFALMAIKNPQFGVGSNGTETLKFPWGNMVAWPWLTFLLFLCIVAGVGNLWRIAESWKAQKPSWGGFVSHIGVAVLMAGLILSRGYERKEQIFVQDGRPARGLDYVFTYRRMTSDNLQNRSNEVVFDVEGLKSKFVATPGLYYTKGEDGKQNAMVWPHIQRSLSHDMYVALHEPVSDVWAEPMRLKPGETKTLNDITVKYRKFFREGQPGVTGTKFGGQLLITTKDGKYEASPTLELTGQGAPQPNLAEVGPDLMIAAVAMDAADQSLVLQMLFQKPIYPIEVFYKPMTVLVWTGTGILTIGGLMAAWYRRRKPTSGIKPTEEVVESNDAPVPAA